MKLVVMFVTCALLAGAACGKKDGDKGVGGGSGGGGGGGGGGGEAPTCSVAAKQYVDLMVNGGGNKLASLKPTPDEAKIVVAKLEADCAANWKGDTRTCVVATKSNFEVGKCYPDRHSVQVGQIVHDTVNELQAARGKAGSGG